MSGKNQLVKIMVKSSNLLIEKKWKLFFILSAIEGLAAFAWTAGISSDSESAFFLVFQNPGSYYFLSP